MDYSKIRQKARETLHGNWGVSVLCTVIYIILVLCISVLGALNPILQLVLWVFVSIPIMFGLIYVFKKLHFEKDDNLLPNLFKISFADQKRYFRIIGAGVSSCVIIFLGSLLLIIPGIMLSLAYALVPFIVVDNPELPIDDVLTRSRKMMNGYKWKLFVLYLTFIGWIILSILTLGIGFIFLSPYMSVALAEFYAIVKKDFRKKTFATVLDEDTLVKPQSEDDAELL